MSGSKGNLGFGFTDTLLVQPWVEVFGTKFGAYYSKKNWDSKLCKVTLLVEL